MTVMLLMAFSGGFARELVRRLVISARPASGISKSKTDGVPQFLAAVHCDGGKFRIRLLELRHTAEHLGNAVMIRLVD